MCAGGSTDFFDPPPSLFSFVHPGFVPQSLIVNEWFLFFGVNGLSWQHLPASLWHKFQSLISALSGSPSAVFENAAVLVSLDQNISFTIPITTQGSRSPRLLPQLKSLPGTKSRRASRFHEVLVIWQIFFENQIPRMSHARARNKAYSRYTCCSLSKMHARAIQRHTLAFLMRQRPRKSQRIIRPRDMLFGSRRHPLTKDRHPIPAGPRLISRWIAREK